MIYKNEMPILEYDDDQFAPLNPKFNNTDDKTTTKFPKKAIFLFLKDETIEKFVDKYHGKQICLHRTISKFYPVYAFEFKNEEMCVMQAPVGAAVAGQILDWLIAHGVKKIVACGSCGVLEKQPDGALLIPEKALRDEATSCKYIKPSRFVKIDEKVVKSIEKTLKKLKLSYSRCTTWTTDAIFRETTSMIEYRKSEGCKVVEMECSALAAVAEFRKAKFGQLLFMADSLIDSQNHDSQNWGKHMHEVLPEICLEIISDM